MKNVLKLEYARQQLLKIFPTLTEHILCYLNLDDEAQRLCEQEPELAIEFQKQLIDASLAQTMIDSCHLRCSANWSYGGYLELREFLLSGSYLKKYGTFLHLGVDVNVPLATPLYCSQESEVLIVDDEQDYNGGWGPRVITKVIDPTSDGPVFIWGHLQNIQVEQGAIIKAGQCFAEIGSAPTNGNWWPHLHLQALSWSAYTNNFCNQLNLLDGYGSSENKNELSELFPEPISLL